MRLDKYLKVTRLIKRDVYKRQRFVSLDAVWLAFPIAEMVSLCLALVMYRRIYHRQISTLKTTP